MVRQADPRLDMKDIHRCVICERRLLYPRTNVDTCGANCSRQQREREEQVELIIADYNKESRLLRDYKGGYT